MKHRHLQNLAQANVGGSNESLVVEVGKRAHQELAVKSVCNTAMTRNGVAKVLNAEGSLQSTSKESTKWSNQRGKSGKHSSVEVHRHEGDDIHTSPLGNVSRQLVDLTNEHRVWVTMWIVVDGSMQVCSRADQVVGLRQEVGEQNSSNTGTDPCTHETFDGFLWGNFNQLRPTKRDSTEIGENVVDNDQRSRKHQPDDSVEDVLDDKVRLEHNEKQSHVGSTQGSKLEPVETLLQSPDEENKTCNVETVRDKLVVLVHEGQHFQRVYRLFKEGKKGLSIQVVDGGHQKVPVQRFVVWDVFVSGGFGRQGDDLLECQCLEQNHHANEW